MSFFGFAQTSDLTAMSVTDRAYADAKFADVKSYTDSVAVSTKSSIIGRDYLSVRDFGAVGDGIADDYDAIQKTINEGLKSGKNVFLPAGYYEISKTLIIDRSAVTYAENDPLRISFTGAGRGNTMIKHTGSGECLKYVGNPTAIYAENVISGLRLFGGSSALSIEYAAWFTLKDMALIGCDVGLLLKDALCGMIESCYIGNNTCGVSSLNGSISQANALTFTNCELSHNAQFGVNLINPTTVNFIGGSIQDNKGGGVNINNTANAQQGAWSSMFSGVYFEANQKDADIVYSNLGSSNKSGILVQGCNFVRFGGSGCTNNILVNSQDNSPTQVVVIGCGFVDYGGTQSGAHMNFIGSVVPTVLGCVQ